MRRTTIQWAGLTLAFLLAAMSAVQAKPVPFRGILIGYQTGSYTVEGHPELLGVTVDLAGRATHLGHCKASLDHQINQADMSFAGTTIFTAANGDTFRTEFAGQGYPTPNPAVITFTVRHVIVAGSGTGRLAGITGVIDGEGFFNFATGLDVVSYLGTIDLSGP